MLRYPITKYEMFFGKSENREHNLCRIHLKMFLSLFLVSDLLPKTVRCVCGTLQTREQLRKHIFFLKKSTEEFAHIEFALALRTHFKDVMVLRRGQPDIT